MKKLCEVGIGHIGVCYGALHWDNPDIEIVMFEPNKKYYNEILSHCQNKKNVKIYNLAIGDFDGEIDFFESETSSFIKGIHSPIKIGDKNIENYLNSYKVQVKKISDFDDGKIDYLRVDTEGAEWFTIKHLISRPQTIHLETHSRNASFINEYFYQIEEWMRNNRYQKVHVDHCDTIYQKI